MAFSKCPVLCNSLSLISRHFLSPQRHTLCPSSNKWKIQATELFCMLHFCFHGGSDGEVGQDGAVQVGLGRAHLPGSRDQSTCHTTICQVH